MDGDDLSPDFFVVISGYQGNDGRNIDPGHETQRRSKDDELSESARRRYQDQADGCYNMDKYTARRYPTRPEKSPDRNNVTPHPVEV